MRWVELDRETTGNVCDPIWLARLVNLMEG